MEKYLVNQVAMCTHYKEQYEEQGNKTMANMFSAHLSSSTRDLELLRLAKELPKYRLETVTFNGSPFNTDVQEKELQLVIKTSKLPVPENAQVYIIGEFSFSMGDQPMTSTISRWAHHVKVEPKNLFCCNMDPSRQLDIIYSTTEKPFTNPSSDWLLFDRPMSFTVYKGKSRTHKRKFSPIKITFFERTSLLRCDRKLGALQLRVDSINDDARIKTKQVIMNGCKDTGAFADITIKVRRPLVDSTIRAQEEKLLLLS